MKKVFDQTVRDLKREVNKKVLKVPGIEQKVLDATSNEPWGPHGSHLADIAQATRNYNEYQMIMTVLWKRINDTGKNWRHVYKALTVLDYLVAHGSERVIDEIREHAYQISTLSDFQYIDSSGRDQGSNVRKKSQSLVSLVNDKERIQEVRQKAFTNRDKYRGTSSTGGMYRPSSYSGTGGYGDRYDDDRHDGRYGNRDDDRNGYGKEREWGSRDDDRYGRGGDSRSGDRYGRDSDERYGRDGYRDDDYRRNQGYDDYQYGSRSRSSDREKDRPYEDDDRHSSRSGGGRADENSPDERRLERKLSELNGSGPPSYEEAVNDVRSHTQDERDGGPVVAAPAPKTSSPAGIANQVQDTTVAHMAASSPNKEVDAFDEFDPRASASAAPPAASAAEMDLFGVLSESNSLALVPVTSVTTTSESDAPTNSGFGSTFVPLSSASTVLNQPSEDPFGDGPFKAIPSADNFPGQPQSFAPTNNLAVQPQSFAPTNNLAAQPQSFAPTNNFVAQPQNFSATNNLVAQPQNFAPTNNLVAQHQNFAPTNNFAAQPQNYATANNFAGQPQNLVPTNNFTAQPQNFAPTNNFAAQAQNFVPTTSFQSPATSEGSITLQPAALKVETVANFDFGDTFQGITFAPSSATNVQLPSATPEFLPPEMAAAQQGSGFLGNVPQPGLVAPSASQGPVALIASQAALCVPPGPPATAQPPKDKFETKSTVWTDTLNRGLVNLNISGSKINPLADIGIDFDSINRMEKRKEKSSATPATSTITMGKAMGSGSGIGRAGANALRPPPNLMMGQNMGMGMGGGAAVGMGMTNVPGMGMGNYGGGMYQPMGMNMGMGVNMGMGQGVQMRPGMPPGPGMAGGFNPMMGMGGYSPQQPYGGYR